ncbi:MULTISPECIES: NADPH:quinone reductase [Streptomyces]|uniref:NADPH:quinone reductase n=1 Tax=Streptomyces TaxID=1883 RepID=UPI00081BC412|nr:MULTISPECIES: NADPH:quinone reductase [unclassified Streptomyces]MYQ54595.1 zinc-binding dehydrogenase [Streptomyces sp. SID4941]SCE25465.1 2-desacetyl-2-hydroxyethyl bacteriochlorophyllide A dehydrogenase [Streptomyces sp. PalvLS-984]SDC90966.1 2-desacetyl-2-hydroxyethyl bacteriochlorophyllide A dehydrogenase [Streptomyces sp. AmelKG-A3]
MRAAYVEELGPPDLIRVGEVPPPRPGPDDVLVDVELTAVNHVDTFVRSGAWRTPVPFPFVIGRDVVGTVTRAGPGAPGFAAGDRVWCSSLGHAGRQGAAAERVAVPADRLYRLPGGVDAVDAVALSHPASTAYLALFTHGRMRAGETVVVLGGAGNVGGAAVVMAAQAGARVVAVASAEDADHCLGLGAHHVVDYRDPEAPRSIRAYAPRGVDLHVDTSGTNDLETAVDLLAPRGRAVVLAGLRTRPVLPAGALYLQDRSVRGFAISNARPDELADAAAHINTLLADGTLRPRTTEVLPLDEAAEAHRRLEAGAVDGKLVLRVAKGRPVGGTAA